MRTRIFPSIFKRGLILLGIAKDVDAEDLFETYRSGRDRFTFQDLERCVGRIQVSPSRSSNATLSPERIPLPRSASLNEESLEDALVRKIERRERVSCFS